MKKMMMVTAALLLAGVTQAATMSWQSGTMYLPTSAADGTWNTAGGTTFRVPGGAASQVTAYFFLLSEAQYNSATLIADVTAAMQAETYNLGAANQTVKPTTTTRATNWTEGTYGVGDSGYVLAVWTLDAYAGSFDQDWFMVAKGTGTIPESGANVTIANMAVGIGEWTAVPEPTSMALLALGAAAIGLRRKFRK